RNVTNTPIMPHSFRGSWRRHHGWGRRVHVEAPHRLAHHRRCLRSSSCWPATSLAPVLLAKTGAFSDTRTASRTAGAASVSYALDLSAIETHHSATRRDLEGDRHVPGRFRALVGVTLKAAVEAVPRGVLQRAARHQLVQPSRPGLRGREAPDPLAL